MLWLSNYIAFYMYILLTKREVKDGWILPEFSFCVFMVRDEVEVNKNAKRERGQYPAILTELAWSIKDLLYGIKSTEKNDLRTWRNFICGNETGSNFVSVFTYIVHSRWQWCKTTLFYFGQGMPLNRNILISMDTSAVTELRETSLSSRGSRKVTNSMPC